MKYIFSANKINLLGERPNGIGTLSLIIENIRSASQLGEVEVYWNQSQEFDLIKKAGLKASFFDLEEFNHGVFWSWCKFKALYMSAKKCKKDDFLIHLDLDTYLCRPLDEFLASNEFIASGIEYFDGVGQGKNETLYSNLKGSDCIQAVDFYHEAIKSIGGLSFVPLKYAYNCCIVGGRADHILRLCEQIEADSNLYYKCLIEDWKASCVFEQSRISSFCSADQLKVAILPFSPAHWESKVSGKIKEPFTETGKNENYKITNIMPLGEPTHHHQGIRSSLFMLRESCLRVKDEEFMSFFRKKPPSLHENWNKNQGAK